jgi:GcvH upstream region-like protein
MTNFIASDAEDKKLLGGMWGPNFLNDGVVRKNLLQTGLSEGLVASYAADVNQDLQQRLEKEKRYQLYAHPQAKFLNVENAWNYFAPEMREYLDILQSGSNPVDPEVFRAREQLFLAEKNFPPSLLRQVLRYQEKQYDWLQPDPNLDRTDLSLFGYHTLEDWFGGRFLRLASQFIINAAKVAEQKGYQVSKDEALADLLRNAEISFQENRNNPNLGVATAQEYYREQLHRLGVDQTQAVKIWRQVLLFRRLFQDVGNSMFVDPLGFQQYNNYAQEFLEGEVYHLPQTLRFGTYRNWQKFEVYRDAVAAAQDKNLLAVPTSFYSVADLEKTTPELVQKRYLVDFSEVDKKKLQARVSVKETWNWEVDENHWKLLKKEFPDLGIVKAETRQERFAALDSLDSATRSKIDSYARAAIVDAHPEWLQKALDEAPVKRMNLAVRLKGGALPLIGFDNRIELIELLDQSPLISDSALSEGSKKSMKALESLTANQNNYYRIRVIDRAPDKEVVNFAEASSDGTLDSLLTRKLEAHYLKIRDKSPEKFQKTDKTWKPLAEVQTIVADDLFAPLIQAVGADYSKANPTHSSLKVDGDFAAKHRFYSYLNSAKKEIQENPGSAAKWLQEAGSSENSDKLAVRPQLKEQWKLEKTAYKGDRTNFPDLSLGKEEVFALEPGEWSRVFTSSDGDVAFFALKQKGGAPDGAALDLQIKEAQRLLSDEVQQLLLNVVLEEIKAKKAISFDYLGVQE